MILQKDPRLKGDYRWEKWGCNLNVIYFHVNKYCNYTWTTGKMESIAGYCVRQNWLDGQFKVLQYEQIYRYLGLDVEYVSFDRFYPAEYECRPDEIEHLRWTNTYKGKITKHFTSGDGFSHCTFDPYGVSNTVRYGSVEDKRVFRLPAGMLRV